MDEYEKFNKISENNLNPKQNQIFEVKENIAKKEGPIKALSFLTIGERMGFERITPSRFGENKMDRVNSKEKLSALISK